MPNFREESQRADPGNQTLDDIILGKKRIPAAYTEDLAHMPEVDKKEENAEKLTLAEENQFLRGQLSVLQGSH